MSNEYKPKHYIITPPQDEVKRAALYDSLADFAPVRFNLIPYFAITVRDKNTEKSLLEKLAELPQVSFREALTFTTKQIEGDKNGS